MFLHVFVCPRGLPLEGGVSLMGDVCLWREGVFLMGGLHPGRPSPEIQSTGGRYASYWNAYLFILISGHSEFPCSIYLSYFILQINLASLQTYFSSQFACTFFYSLIYFIPLSPSTKQCQFRKKVGNIWILQNVKYRSFQKINWQFFYSLRI